MIFKYSDIDIIISFTDGLSLTLGLMNFNKNYKKIGCFHGLSDMEFRSNQIFRPWVNKIIEKSLSNLDTIAFFGDNDRKQSIKKYKLSPQKTGLIKFSVDTNFWTPKKIMTEKKLFLLDKIQEEIFKLLINTTSNLPIHIHTDLKIKSIKKI